MRDQTAARKVVSELPWAALGALLAFHVAAGPHLFDSGEIAAAAWELGGSHPPGQPLHALVAHALARLLPVGPLAGRMALVSAGGAVAAAHFTGQSAALLVTAAGHGRFGPWARSTAILSLGLCPLVLRQALRVEVYTLALALTCAGLHALLCWARDGARRHFLHATILAGLAAAVHPPHAAALAVLGLALSAWLRPSVFRMPGLLLTGTLAATSTAAAVYAYLPLRAHAGAFMWGEPGTWPGFLEYVSGQMYASNTFLRSEQSYPHAVLAYLQHITLVTGIVPWLGLPFLHRGIQALGPRLPAAVVTGIVGACAVIAIQPLEIENPDNVAYAGPAAALLVCAGTAGLWLAFADGRRVLATVSLGLVVTRPFQLPDMAQPLASDLPAFETLAGIWTESPAPRALVAVTQDATASNWMLSQRLDGARPDVALFMTGLAASRFHWRSLAVHPAFDGQPRMAPGRTRHERLLLGLLAYAKPSVPIYLEQEAPGFERMALSGAYLVQDESHGGIVRSWSIGERLSSALGFDRRLTPAGDHELAAAILMTHELTRARRLIARGDTPDAMRAILYGLPDLDGPTAAAIARIDAPPRAAFPPVVGDPARRFMTRAEAERTAAAHLWALGARPLSLQLLRQQAERGEARAFLQLAILQRAAGDSQASRQALAAFAQAAPELASEAAPFQLDSPL